MESATNLNLTPHFFSKALSTATMKYCLISIVLFSLIERQSVQSGGLGFLMVVCHTTSCESFGNNHITLLISVSVTRMVFARIPGSGGIDNLGEEWDVS